MQLKRNKEMEFETLKKSHKKQIIIGALAICVIGGTLTFNLTRAKYKVTESIDLAKGTINYKPYDFKIMAMYKSEDGSNYTEINKIPDSNYEINEEKTYCTTDNKTQVKGKIKTENGKHYIVNIAKNDKCYLYFNKSKYISLNSLVDSIAKNANTKIPNYGSEATTDEGVYAISDGMYGGTSYYWRGAATTNYLKFAGFCWRIIRINGDNTIRLIYDGNTCHANGTRTTESIAVSKQQYNISSDNSSYVGWTYTLNSQRPAPSVSGTDSNIKIQTENWYNENIGNNSSYANNVAEGKYCNDRSVGKKSGGEQSVWSATGSYFTYAGYYRIYGDILPTLSCDSNDIYVLKSGAITADELVFAGWRFTNQSNYLYNGQTYWTMTPREWGSKAYVYATSIVGLCWPSASGHNDIRPVINLKSDIKIERSGNGTLDNPYIVEQ